MTKLEFLKKLLETNQQEDMAMGKNEKMPELEKLEKDFKELLESVKPREKGEKDVIIERGPKGEKINYDEWFSFSQTQLKGQLVKLKNAANKYFREKSESNRETYLKELGDMKEYIKQCIYDVRSIEDKEVSQAFKKRLIRSLEKFSTPFNKIVRILGE